MKKVILSLALLAGITSAAHAQSGVLKYGVKGGFNLSSYFGKYDGGPSVGYKPGFAAGVLVNYGLTDNTSVQIEGLYSQKGAFIDDFLTVGSTQYQYRSTIQYIDVPVLFKYNMGDNGKGLFFEIGPQASFAIANREFTRQKGSGAGSGTEADITTSKDGLVPVGIGYVGGIGYQITSGLGLGLRFTGDFSHVYKDGFLGTSGATASNNFRNGVFQVQAHYLFGGK